MEAGAARAAVVTGSGSKVGSWDERDGDVEREEGGVGEDGGPLDWLRRMRTSAKGGMGGVRETVMIRFAGPLAAALLAITVLALVVRGRRVAIEDLAAAAFFADSMGFSLKRLPSISLHPQS